MFLSECFIGAAQAEDFARRQRLICFQSFLAVLDCGLRGWIVCGGALQFVYCCDQIVARFGVVRLRSQGLSKFFNLPRLD
jgi:hypothetical protein